MKMSRVVLAGVETGCTQERHKKKAWQTGQIEGPQKATLYTWWPKKIKKIPSPTHRKRCQIYVSTHKSPMNRGTQSLCVLYCPASTHTNAHTNHLKSIVFNLRLSNDICFLPRFFVWSWTSDVILALPPLSLAPLVTFLLGLQTPSALVSLWN